MHYQAKTLNETELARLQTLESKTGHIIVAWEHALPPAELKDQELGALQELEAELQAVLVAYEG